MNGWMDEWMDGLVVVRLTSRKRKRKRWCASRTPWTTSTPTSRRHRKIVLAFWKCNVFFASWAGSLPDAALLHGMTSAIWLADMLSTEVGEEGRELRFLCERRSSPFVIQTDVLH